MADGSRRPSRDDELFLSPIAKRAHTLNGIELPGSFEEKRVAHGLGAAVQGWLATSIRVDGAVSAEYPKEVRRNRTHLVLTSATPETIDLLVW